MTKLPEKRERVRAGQIWEKRTDLDGAKAPNPKLPVAQVLITGRARNRNGTSYWHTSRYDMATRVSHGINEKDLWRFYNLIGNQNTITPLKNEHLKPKQQHL